MSVPFTRPLSHDHGRASLHETPRFDAPRQLFLKVARFMVIGGINDARAAALLLGWFGCNYRRPLILIRALVLELARVSERRIQLAPPCSIRITRDEAVMLRALGREEWQIERSHADACELLAASSALGAATCFQAVSACFSDLGSPLR